jgi:tetratricopeptide (TPR) repeat protein
MISNPDREPDEFASPTIRPARIDLSRRSVDGAQAASGLRNPRYIAVALLFGLLIAAAVGVIVVLPDWRPAIAPVTSQANNAGVKQAVAATTPPPPAATAPPPGDAPWQKAIRSGLRKDSQLILEQLLEARKSLEEHGVMQWASADFEQAMTTAEAGDKFYNGQEFEQARDSYQKSLDALNGLLERKETLFEESMQKGLQALNDGDSAGAKAALQHALSIDPLDREAGLAMQRAGTLDEVLALIAEGDDLLAADQFEAAQGSYAKAQGLDPAYPVTAEKLHLVENRILDLAFGKHMSAGFAALEAGRLDEARKDFNEAQKAAPNSVEARNALEQVNLKLTGNRIQALLKQAEADEAAEEWQAAQRSYEDALAIDDKLAAAQAGRERTAVRAAIHEQVMSIIDHPDRLYDPKVYSETRTFLDRMHALSDKGPVLSKQLATLGGLMEQAATPVRVRLQSDNQTEVTIYKVGNLGFFTDLELELRPGRYVAVGIRSGYQDARTEFQVAPDQPEQIVQVRADRPSMPR